MAQEEIQMCPDPNQKENIWIRVKGKSRNKAHSEVKGEGWMKRIKSPSSKSCLSQPEERESVDRSWRRPQSYGACVMAQCGEGWGFYFVWVDVDSRAHSLSLVPGDLAFLGEPWQ